MLRAGLFRVRAGGASAFDNAQHALGRGAGEVHVFVRRAELPRVNPIRKMESAGFMKHFADLDDARKCGLCGFVWVCCCCMREHRLAVPLCSPAARRPRPLPSSAAAPRLDALPTVLIALCHCVSVCACRYAGIAFFLSFNQPPTNDTFSRAAAHPNFVLHTGAAWRALEPTPDGTQVLTQMQALCNSTPDCTHCWLQSQSLHGSHASRRNRRRCPSPSPRQVRIHSARGDEGLFDFLVVSTGLLTDARLRPELAGVAGDIATWADRFAPPPGQARHPLIDDHPYLVGGGLLQGGPVGSGRRCGMGGRQAPAQAVPTPLALHCPLSSPTAAGPML